MQHLHDETGSPLPAVPAAQAPRPGRPARREDRRGFFTYDANRRRTDRLPDDQPGLG